MKVKSLSYAPVLATPWTAANQAPPSVGFSRQEYWSGLPVLPILPVLPSPRQHAHWKKLLGVTSQLNNLLQISVQFSSVARPCLTLCDPMDCSTPGLPIHHQLPEFTQTHVHPVGDAIQPSHPLLSPSPLSFNLCQHQGLFK